MKSPLSLKSRPLRSISLPLGVVLITFVMLAGGAVASSTTVPPGTVQWAYAGSSAQTSSGSITFGNTSLQYDIHSFYAWSVVYTQTNLTSSAFMVEGQRTMVEQYFMQLCSPDCQNPIQQGNATLSGWETDTAFVNITTAGTILVNGTTPAPAYAIINAASSSASNMTGTRSWQGAPPSNGCGCATPGGTSSGANGGVAGGSPPASTGTSPPAVPSMAVGSGSSYSSEASTGTLSVAFAPPLGLVPLHPQGIENWTSRSNYTAAGSWSFSFHDEAWGLPSRSGSSTGAVNATGNVTLFGQDWGLTRLSNGEMAWVQAIALCGPFSLWDGIFLVPGPAALWATGGLATSAGGATSSPPATTSNGGSGTTTVSSGGSTAAGACQGLPEPVTGANGGVTTSGSGSSPAPIAPPIELSVATGAIDQDAATGHLGFVAALSAFAPADFSIAPPASAPEPTTPPGPGVSPPSGSSTGSNGAAVDASAASDSTPGSGTVQAQPVDVSTAISLAKAWLAGSPAATGPIPTTVVLGVGALAIVAFAVSVVVVRQRTKAGGSASGGAYAAFRVAVPRDGRAPATRKGEPARTSKPSAETQETDPLDALL